MYVLIHVNLHNNPPYTHTHTHANTHMHAYIYKYMCVFVYTHTHTEHTVQAISTTWRIWVTKTPLSLWQAYTASKTKVRLNLPPTWPEAVKDPLKADL